MSPRVLMANLSAPELRYLASEFARRELLVRYVCRYANQNRGWERALARLPGAGRAYMRSLGRRRLPQGLLPQHITEAGVASDFLAALITRIGLPAAFAVSAATRLHRRAVRRIATRAAQLHKQASVVVAGVGMATPLFRLAAGTAERKVLNYPSAHHRFQAQFFAHEMEKLPEFAQLGEGASDVSPDLAHQFDTECAQADLILTGSRFARDSFLQQGFAPEKVAAIPYGVDTRLFSPSTAPRASGRFRVVFVGRIGYRKGIGYLLHAMRRIHRPDMELELVGAMVGDTRCLRPYSHLFQHVPHVPQSLLPEIYRSADVFVFPSLLEGLGLVALEAMACGCPVIVSRNGPGDVVRDGVDGFVVPASDSEALAAAIEKMYIDREMRERMGRSARAQAETFGWHRYMRLASAAVLGERDAEVAS
jgi:glycosyltransferase involved in cell wall biosynthesis